MADGTFSLTDIIKSFEDRLAQLEWERDEANRKAENYRELYLKSEQKFKDRPFKPIHEYDTEEIVAVIKHRLDWYNESEDDARQ